MTDAQLAYGKANMWMTDYIMAVKRGLRDQHGFVPTPESSRQDPCFANVPDGTYAIAINGKIDYVRIDGGKLTCCNYGDYPNTIRHAQT